MLHRLLKKSHIAGWVANPALRLDGEVIRPDVLLRDARLVIEVDGREFHSGAAAFEHDRSRQNRLVTHGYRVLRFTTSMLQNDPQGVIRTIRAALRCSC
jgi:very-short-patch-repair endonuclease